MSNAYAHILLAHGSRDPRWCASFERLAEALRQRNPGRRIWLAYLELATPSLLDCIGQAVAAGIKDIRVTPLFLAMGAHLARDIPMRLAEAESAFLDLRIRLDPALGEHAAVRAAILASLD
ncbi:MAG: CbiX/SirB N-terminal domain-containing protein [Pseudomonadota bacterium]